MTRRTARELAVQIAYALSFTDKDIDTLLSDFLSPEHLSSLAEEEDLYQEKPGGKNEEYIRRVSRGVAEHAPELDGDIARYAKDWEFERISLVASAIMRVAMYEILYMPDVPNATAVNEAVEIAKKYDEPETARFVNGILGAFVRGEIEA